MFLLPTDLVLTEVGPLALSIDLTAIRETTLLLNDQ
jgi:hypothetical protein